MSRQTEDIIMIDQIAIANMIGLSQGGRICRQTSEDEFYEQYGNSRIVRAIAWLTDIGLKNKGRADEARPRTIHSMHADQAARLAGR
jgi:hypothetical protein